MVMTTLPQQQDACLYPDFPFETVIITFPDEAAAHAAKMGPLQALSMLYPPTTQFVATADPYQARVGSGGGTVAALIDHTSTADTCSDTGGGSGSCGSILILHAGGAASRCPTQMCLGKAWTSIPTVTTTRSSFSVNNNAENANTSTLPSSIPTRVLQTPLQLWLQTCHDLFRPHLPSGTLVVIAADTLLQWSNGTCGSLNSCNNSNDLDWTQALRDGAVLGLAVPAELETAKNHGVFVVPSDGDGSGHKSDTSLPTTRIMPCCTVLQKPSIEVMKSHSNPPCCFTLSTGSEPSPGDDVETQNALCAWIDTGVTIFAPSATQSLCRLARDHLTRCTATGLSNLYQTKHSTDTAGGAPSDADLIEFAARMALSVDLYTHILQALSLDSANDDVGTTAADQQRKQAYLAMYADKELPVEIATAVWDALSAHTLQVLAISSGTFWHLGTTRELQSFLVDAASATAQKGVLRHDDDVALSIRQRRKRRQCQEFGSSLGLTRRHYAYHNIRSMDDFDTTDEPHGIDNQTLQRQRSGGVDPSAVIYHCLLSVQHTSDDASPSQASFIGARSVVEHCCLEGNEPCIRIGSNSLVSGLRSPPAESNSCGDDDGTDQVDKGGIVIPNNMMVQMVRLKAESTDDDGSVPVVIVVLGIDDNVKKRDTLYGKPMDGFLQTADLQQDDIWKAVDQNPTLWTARLHPVVALAKNDSFSRVFSWLPQYVTESNDSKMPYFLSNDTSFVKWKSSWRLSLSEIRDRADAPLEFAYRDEVLTRLIAFKATFDDRLRTILVDRRHDSAMDFQFIVDEYAAHSDLANDDAVGYVGDVVDTLHALDKVVLDCWHRKGSQDISSRACMLQRGLMSDLISSLPTASENCLRCDTDEIGTTISSILTSFSGANSIDSDNTNVAALYSALVSHRDHALAVRDVVALESLSKAWAAMSSALTGRHVLGARSMVDTLGQQPPIYDKWIVATAPARIDLSGGWSDTPPICYEFGSLVTGIAVSLDGRRPLGCRCRLVSGATGVLLRTEARDNQTGELISMVESELDAASDLIDCRDPSADCALLKCTLVHLGLVQEQSRGVDFQSMVNTFCQSKGPVRLELVATTLLPHGSGLGTSSILAGCILAAVGKCIGAGSESSYSGDIVNSVLNVEQYLTTGGGFQDQVNGLVGGAKSVSSVPKEWPMNILYDRIPVAPEFQDQLNSSLVLVFTGKTRLAKNLLDQVLQRWSRQTTEIRTTMAALVHGADECRNAIVSEDLGAVGRCLSDYWTLKKKMAGPSSGVEPPIVRCAIAELNSRRLIQGASLCGAGGGGFMALLRSPGVTVVDLRHALASSDHELASEFRVFTWHECKLCDKGLDVRQLDGTDGGVADFDLAWLGA